MLAFPAHQALAQSTPASTPAKKELVARMIKLQRPGVEAMSRAMAEEPAAQMLDQAAVVASPAHRARTNRRRSAKGIQVDIKKYLDETVPLVRDRALALAPDAVGPLLDKNFSEAELSKILSLLESPEYLKYQKMSGEMQAALQTKLVAETRTGVEAKLKALEAAIGARLGVASGACSTCTRRQARDQVSATGARRPDQTGSGTPKRARRSCSPTSSSTCCRRSAARRCCARLPRATRPAGEDELVLHGVLPAHQLGHGHAVTVRLQLQAAQHIGDLAAELPRVQRVAPQLGQRRAGQVQRLAALHHRRHFRLATGHQHHVSGLLGQAESDGIVGGRVAGVQGRDHVDGRRQVGVGQGVLHRGRQEAHALKTQARGQRL